MGARVFGMPARGCRDGCAGNRDACAGGAGGLRGYSGWSRGGRALTSAMKSEGDANARRNHGDERRISANAALALGNTENERKRSATRKKSVLKTFTM